jgi:hypothetical protein
VGVLTDLLWVLSYFDIDDIGLKTPPAQYNRSTDQVFIYPGVILMEQNGFIDELIEMIGVYIEHEYIHAAITRILGAEYFRRVYRLLGEERAIRSITGQSFSPAIRCRYIRGIQQSLSET